MQTSQPVPADKPRNYDKLFRPRSVAVIGASPKRGTMRNTLVRLIQKHGFPGEIFPVSLSAKEIEGLPAYPNVAALPGTPDVALVITPAETVPAVLEQCGQKGIPAAIVLSSGFEEVKGGRVLAQRLAEVALKYGITLLGPNCQGPWSVRARALLTYSSAAATIDTLSYDPVAIVSQSGALGGALAGALYRSGMGCSYNIALGNETMTDILDILAWVIEQDDVRVVALYIEGLRDGSRIIDIAARATERGIQILALKTGRTSAGQAATASHTGKIASSDAVYSDVFAQAGVVSVDSLAELQAAVEALAFLRDPRSSEEGKGAGLSVISSSGGAGALLADHSGMMSVPLADFDDTTQAKLAAIVPDFGRVANPIDLTGQVRTVPTLFRDACAAISHDAHTEALIVQFASSGRTDLMNNMEVFKDCARRERIPVIVSLIGDMVEVPIRKELRDAGVLVAGDTKMAMQAMQWLYQRRARASRPAPPARQPDGVIETPSSWNGLMKYLSDSGIPPARWTILKPDQGADAACAHMTYPLVVKVLPDDAEHKTELGLVQLRVQSPEEVDRYAAEFRQKLDKPGLEVLVQEMIGDGVEVVLACLRNPDFGPILSIGSGGVAIELYKDVVYLALPVTPQQVLAALQKLKLAVLLKGFRGKPAADVAALAHAAAAFGNRFMASRGIAELEVNPVIVRPVGEGIVAVDALVVRASPT